MLTGLPRTLRVHSFTGRITLDTLHKAFKAVKRNRGAAGLDKPSITLFAANLEENLLAVMRDVKAGTYQPIPLRRVYIPKGPGKFRPLGIPSVRCRVAQEVTRALIEPIFAPTFHDSSHGFRRRRSCHTAMAQLVELHQHGYRVVVEADLKGCFDVSSQKFGPENPYPEGLLRQRKFGIIGRGSDPTRSWRRRLYACRFRPVQHC